MTRTITSSRARRAAGGLLTVAVALATMLTVATPAGAKPIGGGDGGGGNPPDKPVPFTKPAKGLDYKMLPRATQWAANWRSGDDTTNKPWPKDTYNPAYVHPQFFQAVFDTQCIDATDWNLSVNQGQLTVNTYKWTYGRQPGSNVTVSNRYCENTLLNLQGQGLFTVKLEVIAPNNQVLVTKVGYARVKDHLIVVIGDSAASGEGAPDGELNPNGTAEYGYWTDRRCHRSANAAGARAAMELEAADPHSTVTFLSFACSGATVGDVDPGKGVGILAPYDGIEGKGLGPSFYLPSQIDQLAFALGQTQLNQVGLPARTVDRLFISGGINDVHFADLASTCILFTDCPNDSGFFDAGPLKLAYEDLASKIPGYYVQLKNGLASAGVNVAQALVMEYPNPLTASNGQLCTTMLGDVLPASSVNLLLLMLTTPLGLPFIPILTALVADPTMVPILPILFNGATGQLRWDSSEIQWMNSTGMPRLRKAGKDGATQAGFTFVEGIADKFIKHGYCANDNWLRRAPESSRTQGPWNFVSKPIGSGPGLGLHILTKGLIHPNPKGYAAIAKVLSPYVLNLVDKAPVAKNDSYSTNQGELLDLAFGAGVTINDSDPNGDEFIVEVVKQPKGTLVMSTGGGFTYMPPVGFAGKDTFTYRLTDGGLWSNVATVSINVVGRGGPPPPITWDWTYNTGDGIPKVFSGSVIEIPICNRCGPRYEVSPVIRKAPGFGTVELIVVGDGVKARFTAVDTSVDQLDSFDVDMMQGTKVVGSATVQVDVVPQPR